jgi:hypothetical protein
MPLFADGRGKWLAPQVMAGLVSRAAGLAGIIPPRAAAAPTWQDTSPTFTPGLEGGAQVLDLRPGPTPGWV